MIIRRSEKNWFSLFARTILGMVAGSLLAAVWFSVAVSLTEGPGSLIDAILSVAGMSIVLFQAMFIFAIYCIVGIPLFFVARRLKWANTWGAVILGFLVGLSVSVLYGSTDSFSLVATLKLFVTFGLSGILAGWVFWKVASPAANLSRIGKKVE